MAHAVSNKDVAYIIAVLEQLATSEADRAALHAAFNSKGGD